MKDLLSAFTIQPYQWQTYPPNQPLCVPFADAEVRCNQVHLTNNYDVRVTFAYRFAVPHDSKYGLDGAAADGINAMLRLLYEKTQDEIFYALALIRSGATSQAVERLETLAHSLRPNISRGDVSVFAHHIKVTV